MKPSEDLNVSVKREEPDKNENKPESQNEELDPESKLPGGRIIELNLNIKYRPLDNGRAWKVPRVC